MLVIGSWEAPPCPHPSPGCLAKFSYWMWGWGCFPLCIPHQRRRSTALTRCVVSDLMAPSPCRVSGPGRLSAQVLQRPRPAHEGGRHVWVLPACVRCDLPMVGVETESSCSDCPKQWCVNISSLSAALFLWLM